MGLGLVQRLSRELDEVQSVAALEHVFQQFTYDIGYSYFFIYHHVDPAIKYPGQVLIHNFPKERLDYYLTHRFFEGGPITRAVERSISAFYWSDLDARVTLTAQDIEVLERSRGQGALDGLTVPLHLPGEPSAGCSFVTPAGDTKRGGGALLEDDALLWVAQLISIKGFEIARRLTGRDKLASFDNVRLTERQRQCLVLAAKGKGDREIADSLGISEETATIHLRMARDRYGVSKRLPLAVRALYDGQISFWEIMD